MFYLVSNWQLIDSKKTLVTRGPLTLLPWPDSGRHKPLRAGVEECPYMVVCMYKAMYIHKVSRHQ